MKIMTVTVCSAMAACLDNPTDYLHELPTGATLAAIAEHAMARLVAARAEDYLTHAANTDALFNNQQVRDTITAFMDDIGMPRLYRLSESARKQTCMVHQLSGYIFDMDREVLTTDDWAWAEDRFEKLLPRYEALVKSAQKELAHA